MSDTIHITGLPVPLPAEAASGPAAFTELRDALTSHIVYQATTESNRNSLYGALPTGSLVASTATNTVWMKTDSGWSTIYYDSGWTSLSAAAWTSDASDNGSFYRMSGSRIEIHIDAIYNGSSVSGGGNIADIKVLDLPTECYPKYNYFQGVMIAASGPFINLSIYASGGIYMSSIANVSTLSSGTRIQGTATYFTN